MAKENPYLDVQKLTKSFGALVLFHDLSFSIAEGQKVGLIAKNGTGKSTLLSILSGKEGYDQGEIIFRRDLKVGMLEQSPAFDPAETIPTEAFASIFFRLFRRSSRSTSTVRISSIACCLPTINDIASADIP